MGVCDCDWNSYMVGDGCDKCNPARALEYARETIAEMEEQLASSEAALREAREVLREATYMLGIIDSDGNWRIDPSDKDPAREVLREATYMLGIIDSDGNWRIDPSDKDPDAMPPGIRRIAEALAGVSNE